MPLCGNSWLLIDLIIHILLTLKQIDTSKQSSININNLVDSSRQPVAPFSRTPTYCFQTRCWQ